MQELAEEGIPAGRDPWPAIRVRLEAREAAARAVPSPRTPRFGRFAPALALIAVLFLGALGASSYLRGGESVEIRTGAAGTGMYDPADPRQLVGAADAVFVGRVMEQIGSFSPPPSESPTLGPRTQFWVRVEETIKSVQPEDPRNPFGPVQPTPLEPDLVVNQDAGYGRDPDGTRYLFLPSGPNGQPVPLLEPGKTYLFVARYQPASGWYTITDPGRGNIPIESDEERAELVRRFREAVREEVRPQMPGP